MKLLRKQRVPVGARPGTLAAPEDSPPPRVHYIDYTADELQEGDVAEVGALEAIAARTSITWVDVQGLGDPETLRQIGRIFSFHDLLLEDVANVPQRPKVDQYDEQLVVVVRMLRLGDDAGLVREQVSLVVGGNYVLTFQEQYGDILDPVRQRLRAGKGPIRKAGSDYLAYVILDTIVDGYFPVLEEIGDRLESLEDDVIAAPVPATLRRVNEVKALILTLRRILWPTRDAIQRLAREAHRQVREETLVYFRDTHDHCLQLVELVEAFRELASGLMNTYLSAAGNRMNEIMKVLTIMASIFIPLTFMAGIYGMNFESMPELRTPWAYPVLLGLMAAVAVLMLVFFRRRGWIGGEPPVDRSDPGT